MLTVDNINLHYGAAQALRGVSLTAEMGKITCVLGRNGVGKSSLLRAITGQHPVSAGQISFGEASLDGLAPYARAKQGIGYVPQGREIFPLLTVQENLESGFAPLPRKDRFIPDEIFSLFPVLGSMLSRRGGDLSGGQQQQLAIGRASRRKASSLPSSRTLAGRSAICAIPPGWPFSWWNSISTSAASLPIMSILWIVAKLCTKDLPVPSIRQKQGDILLFRGE
jgi:ABC-type hemin transport system ATPase subunit